MKIRKQLVFGLLCILGLSSCVDSFEHSNKRILGRWEFIEATKRPTNTYDPRESILDQYENDQIEFFDDNIFSYTHATDSGSITKEGLWSFSEVTVIYPDDDFQDEDNEEYYIILTMSMKNPAGELVQHTWQILGITHKRCQIKETREDFEYRYTLKTLD